MTAPALTLDAVRGRATISVDECAALLSLSRGVCYQACHDGSIPSLRVGSRRLVIPVAALLRLLGDEPTAPAGAAEVVSSLHEVGA